ncbi:MAG TPA: glycerol-3-phosphate 1-O-acyltransferase PlsY [Phycisphaerae bacterium]|nr:glycerol-3-phosphate 1-O-acyltransferase PlsY [Phycisphaerae bacterium]
MSATATLVLLIVGAYLMGGIPFGLLVGWVKGIDVRTAGSRNIGATNVSRLLGRPYGVLVFALDVLKGLVPTVIAGSVLIGLGGREGPPEAVRYLCWLAIGIACVLGHNYPVYLGFRGGKGVSTSLGVTLGVYPDLTIPGLAAFGIWVIVVATSRYISVGSVAAGVAFPILFLVIARYRGRSVIDECWPLLAFSVLLGVLVVVRHRANLGRLLAGTESKIGRRPMEQMRKGAP